MIAVYIPDIVITGVAGFVAGVVACFVVIWWLNRDDGYRWW